MVGRLVPVNNVGNGNWRNGTVLGNAVTLAAAGATIQTTALPGGGPEIEVPAPDRSPLLTPAEEFAFAAALPSGALLPTSHVLPDVLGAAICPPAPLLQHFWFLSKVWTSNSLWPQNHQTVTAHS